MKQAFLFGEAPPCGQRICGLAAALIYELLRKQVSAATIAREVACCRSTVYRWKRKLLGRPQEG